MDERTAPALHALPDGEAELSLVVRLPWEDIARLGQDAARLAAQTQRPVTLDEAVSHRLRTLRTTATHARQTTEHPPQTQQTQQTPAQAQVASLPRLSGTG
ncbi:hypothetical protein KUM39_07560 [Streptomyces sp. J2-1]|uniref:hypothetical protein n=1 Tax=Streptomyces corallincola TaxID=2851888 RepID=UPI001C38E978|nr:hypothetical protein [Streptomyces corallincola]MBV2354219.1 hypothetical protein [Streptomyces corallincola]